MADPLIERVQREASIPDLLDALVERLAPTDLQSLLLEVFRRRAAAITPAQLIASYERNRFARPSAIDPRVSAEVDRRAFSVLPSGFEVLELSPVCPLGTNAAVATVDQNKVLGALRGTEVVADPTNVLALECALRRRRLLRGDPRSRERVRLATSHRTVRGQVFGGPDAYPHFRLLGLCTAGRDQGSSTFESEALIEHVVFWLRLLGAFGKGLYRPRVALTDFGLGPGILHDGVMLTLARHFPEAELVLDPDRATGRGYYVGACFKVHLVAPDGTTLELGDGGFTTWTQQLLSNRKERLLISAAGTERLCRLLTEDASTTHPGRLTER
jgi:hypothetical protein